MTSQEGKTQSLLACPECGIGWADCACVSSWSTPEEKEKRDAEIRAIKAEVYEKIEKRARPTKSFSKVVAAFDSTLLAELQERGGSRGLSSYVVKLFTTHSSRKKVVSRQSSVVRVEQKVSLSFPSYLAKRLELRAKKESKNPSVVLVEHCNKELAWERSKD